MQTYVPTSATNIGGEFPISEKALEARARRAARRAGYVARKSRWRAGSGDNFGEFMIVDPSMNIPVAGYRYDLSAEEVVEWCRDE